MLARKIYRDVILIKHWRRGGLVVSVLDSGSSGPGSSP